MSYVKHHQFEKRQELFNNVNPLMRKYKIDGAFPPTYVPMDKRKSITHYMGRSSFAPGYYGKLNLININLNIEFFFLFATFIYLFRF